MTNDRIEPRSPSGGDHPSCQDYESQLSAYVLGELDVLSDDERAGLEAHLECCERCREEEALLRRTVEAVTEASAGSTAEVLHLEPRQLEPERRDAVLSQAAGAVTGISKNGASKKAASRTASTRRASGGSSLARRLGWIAAAAVILACVVPFLMDGPIQSGGSSAPAVGVTSVSQLAPELPERSGEPASVVATETFASEGGAVASVPRTPGLSIELEVTETAGATRARGAPADFSVTELAAAGEREWGELNRFNRSDATRPSSAPISEPAPDVTFRLSAPEDTVELASALGERQSSVVDRGTTREDPRFDRFQYGETQADRGTSLGGARGIAEGEAEAAGRRYKVFTMNEPMPGTDGTVGAVDDRVLLSGGGTDGRFAGADPAAPTSEALLPPNATASKPSGPGPVTASAAPRATSRAAKQAEDTRSASARRGGVTVDSIDLGGVAGGVTERRKTSTTSGLAPATPLHYPRNTEPLSVGGGAGGAVSSEEARDRTIDVRAGLASGAAGAAGQAGRPRGEAATSEASDYFLALNVDGLEAAAPSDGASAPSRGRSREPAAAESKVNGASLYGRAARAEPDAAAPAAGATEAPKGSSLGLNAKRPAAAGEDAKLGAIRVPELKQLQEQVRVVEEERLRQVERSEQLQETAPGDKNGYLYKKYDEATKEVEPNNRPAELAKLVESEVPDAESAGEGRSPTRRRLATRPVVDAGKLVEDYMARLARRPGETPDMMFFRYWGTNPFVEASVDNQSTFAVDVDTASYTLTRKYLTDRGVLPPREAIRTEEFLNYFDYEYAPPADGQAFAVHTEMAPSPFGHEPQYQLLKVGIKGREVTSEKRKPCALVFVVDTSGSMGRESRLELVKDGLRLLVREVDEGDTIGIVAFDHTSRVILEPTPADQKEKIIDAINTLQPRRNTNVDSGLTAGYQMAGASFLERGTNRVLLLSDGVANTGVTDVNGMLANVEAQRRRGIFLTCIGVGMGNHNDTLLEQLADRGDGQCVYVDRLEEAQKVFVENLAGTLETIARDVKIQVEFDKEKVLRYRLLGYENRAIADSAFRDDTVDAGEVGAGHSVTAVYELKCRPDVDGKVATVRVRHLKVDSREPVELEHVVDTSKRRGSFADASPRFQLAALAGEFAEILRDSYWARGSDLGRVAAMTQDLLGEGGMKLGRDPEVVELAALMFRAAPLVEARRNSEGELAQVVDALKENTHLRSRADELRLEDSQENRFYLEDLQRQNEELRRRLERLLDQRVSGGR